MVLHNKINTDELRERARTSDVARTTLSFYRYVKLEDPKAFRNELYKQFSALEVLGRIYVAEEGINAQASVPTANFEAFQNYVNSVPELKDIRLNLAVEDDDASFFKLILRVRPKILADGLDDSSFDPGNSGEHLDAVKFNEIAQHPDAVIIDMRNHYEHEVGHFEGAVKPPVDTFRQSLPIVEDILNGKQDAPVLMYCTGGIRCEKASAWFKHRGFNQVYQLDGGIINYARQVEKEGLDNRFKGKNFVFDERLGERIGEEVISSCHQCGSPSDRHINCANDLCHVLIIQCEACAKTYEESCSKTCASYAAMSKEERNAKGLGLTFNGHRFPNGHYRSDMGELPLE